MRWILLILVVFSTQVEASRLRTFLGSLMRSGNPLVASKPWYVAWGDAYGSHFTVRSKGDLTEIEVVEGEVLTSEEKAKIRESKEKEFEGAQVYCDGKFYYIPSRIFNNRDPFDIDEKD